MNRRNFRSEKGITLVALAVTMIVLAILLGVTIRMVASNESVVKQAQVTKQKDDLARLQERVELWKSNNSLAKLNRTGEETPEDFIKRLIDDGIITEENVVGNKITLGSYTVDLYTEYEGLLLTDFAKVGDYVKYIPDGPSSYTIPEEDTSWIHQYNSSTIKRSDSTNWVVLKNDGRNVTLISEYPIGSITMKRRIAYLKGPTILNEILSTIYGGSKGTARSINVDDINEILRPGFDDKDETNWYCRVYDATNGYRKEFLSEGMKTIGQVEEYIVEQGLGEKLEYRETPDGTDIENYVPNYYSYVASDYITDSNSAQYNILFKGINTSDGWSGYWLASNATNVEFMNGKVLFNLRAIRGAEVHSTSFFSSDGVDIEHRTFPVRPIVVLNSDVKIWSSTDTGASADEAWQLK